ncbi:hypothetical protein [Acinetobacter guerrae]|uniref:hypothetical protein n=1 Tax=Acinetobacter guerrae TaxID=1843371 RepID=UPI00128E1EEC|nr:hypothetical protein [Acinetobacter guerrae]MPW44732.1 hypothetical protein [Acinetobacter guerrae]
MTILFSVSRQAFFASELNYSDLPNDLIEINQEQHIELLTKLNTGCYIKSDLITTSPKPTSFHVWSGKKWVDPRTAEEKRADLLKTVMPLTRRQFMLVLALHNLDEQVETAISNIEDVKQKKLISIEYRESTQFERTSDSVAQISQLLNLTDDQVDILWVEAMNL